MKTNPVRFIPSIKDLQDNQRFQTACSPGNMSQDHLTRIMQQTVKELREQILLEPEAFHNSNRETITKEIFARFESQLEGINESRLVSVINGTGIILHTNLGRARLSEAAVMQMLDTAKSYTNLEFDLEKGERGSRHDHVEELLCQLTGAEAAMVVNNNAAAVFLVLRAFAKRREVIVSRGELVEIGGSFRISSIMEESDAQLVEIGTTNKTHPKDYIEAITEQTAMVLKVHRSNFKLVGFTESVNRETLKEIAQENQLLFFEDLGSGAFFDFKAHGIGDEPLVTDVIKKGVDIVSCSGDKLLGGPQAGIILGKKDYINKLKKHQLARTLRVDKITLASLYATLKAYLNPNTLIHEVPTVRDMLTQTETLKARADKVLAAFLDHPKLRLKLVETEVPIGGGTLPGVTVSSISIAFDHVEESANAIGCKLRMQRPALVTRIKDESVIIDFRTVSDEEVDNVIAALDQL